MAAAPDSKALGKQLGGALNSIAYGQAMIAAARDYVKELEDEAAAAPSSSGRDVDVDELLDDPELEALHRDRLAALRQEAERRAALERRGHGSYAEVAEGDFLEVVTKTESVVVHFYHKDFERCRIVDKHMAQLAAKFLEARFVKVSAPDAPFFTVKLGIKVLPAVVMFRHGVSVDRVVGFEQLGGRDDFSTAALEARLRKAGIVGAGAGGGGGVAGGGGESDSDGERERRQQGGVRRGFAHRARDEDDESSDFDD